MENKQTAVKWLEEKIKINKSIHSELKEVMKYAKAMEKEQIMKAYDEGDIQLVNAEQYYNETYGKN